jgi:Zn-dependent protease with chaperone function/tellurite resistance protein
VTKSSQVEVYPLGPAAVPADLLTPSAAYRRHAYLAIAALLAFVAAYLGFTAWLVWIAYRAVMQLWAENGSAIHLLLMAFSSALLAVFMIKGLVFIKRGAKSDGVELTATQHPQLFAFLHRMADEARAPRPHRVFVSTQVNAAVYYDLSLLNLLFPSKKNLEIGLGLVNALTLSELKAVLAHELGHFAQRTMAIGRWVYIGQQIAEQIVHRRDALDRWLVELSSTDPRIAWIGWVLRLVIWSIRSLVDTAFRWVMLAKRALSREMERQADLVSVSLAGSDALIHALYKLGAADLAMDRAVSFLAKEAGSERAVADVLAVQSRMLEHMRKIFAEPELGTVPPLPLPEEAPAHRLFKAQLAHPPRMWSTHPSNDEREANAKRRYLGAPLDDRSAWLLFEEPQALRAQTTKAMYVEGKRPEHTPPLEETLRTVDEQLAQPYFDPGYRGAYLGRSPVRRVERPGDLYEAANEASADAPAEALGALYPESLGQELARRRELLEEHATLEAVVDGQLQLPGGVLQLRGKEHRRRELPALLAHTKRELAELEEQLTAHDRRCRTVHLAAARALAETHPGWESYLRGALELLHYADHTERDLDDAIGALSNAVAIATADGHVSDRERARVLEVAHQLYDVLARVHGEAEQIELGPEIAARMKQESWAKLLGPLELPPPMAENFGSWMGAIDSWAGSASHGLGELRHSALAILLGSEQKVAAALRGGEPLPEVPAPSPAPPRDYPCFLEIHERPLQTKLDWWDRFAVADGPVATGARLAVAGSIVAAVVWLGSSIDSGPMPSAYAGDTSAPSTILVYNGLLRPVKVKIYADPEAMSETMVAAEDFAEVTLEQGVLAEIFVMTIDGVMVEGFTSQIGNGQSYLYNISQAAALSLPGSGDSSRITIDRWMPLAPSMTLGRRSVTTLGWSDARPPGQISAPLRGEDWLATFEPEFGGKQLVAMATAHATWDPLESPTTMRWMTLLGRHAPGELLPILVARKGEHAASDVMLRRLEQEYATEPKVVCERDRKAAQAEAAGADAQYLAARCLTEPARGDALLALAEKWPEHPWLIASSGHVMAERNQWKQAIERFERARDKLPRQDLEVMIARARRAASPGVDEPDLADLQRTSPLLGMLAMLPGPMVPPPVREVYEALRQGRPEEALQLAAAFEYDDSILPIVAASDGAPVELAAKLMGKPLRTSDERIGRDELAARYGLAVREGRDPLELGDLRARILEKSEPHGAEIGAFLDDLVRRRKGARGNDAAVRGLRRVDVILQGFAYATAVIALGERCPPAWRQLAKRLLFVTERPYFR